MDLGLTFTKYVVFFFNFLFAIIGIAMITVGAIVRTKIVDYHDFIDYDLTPYPILLIVAGCVVFLIAFLGCCGACKESTCMIFLYSIIVILIVAFEVGIIVAAYVKRNDVENIVDKKLNYTLHKVNEIDTFAASWHLLQTELKCCGIKGPEDWDGILPGQNSLPASCCLREKGAQCSKGDASVQKDGCKAKFLDYLKSNLVTVAGVGIGVAVIQLFAIVFSCCLYSAYRRDVHY
ncbi:23 kDa integral membrane protein-like isoform X2 [Sitodiplosis mosellana]|uniref:23 kDa integral membrane protein-like isoform X2 n=1 Tax=Sitodiplosis mosellana TaxID=263140 RepID=UPI002444A44A|nr:23 kDa integral membrane protein-like isoform X2 [Sitodiplosis mosellana]